MFRKAIKDKPEFPRAIVNLAATLASESRFAEARDVLQQALRIAPENKDAQQLEVMLKAQGDR
jgi:cytochrome c-type biogenesis protein CcmH/NrfG